MKYLPFSMLFFITLEDLHSIQLIFLAVAYNILFEFDILYFINLIPSEQYMNNFVAVALVFLFIKIYEDTVSLNSPK